MTTITIERARIEEWFEALSTAKNGLLWFIDSYPQDVNGCDDEAMSEIDMTLEAMSAALAADHALREQVQPEKAFVCSLGCTTECIARQHGVPSECPSLPRQPVITPATAQAAEIARLRSESEERLQNCVALVAEVERLRKDAGRYQWLAEYLVSDDESYDDAIVAATTVKEVDSVIDNAMKGTS